MTRRKFEKGLMDRGLDIELRLELLNAFEAGFSAGVEHGLIQFGKGLLLGARFVKDL